MDQSALFGNEIVSDFYKFTLREVKKLGGIEEDMIEVLEIKNRHKLSQLIARVITGTCDVKEMSWVGIAKSKDLEERVKLNALDHITIDKALEEVALANIEVPHGAISFGLSNKNSKMLGSPWPEQPRVVYVAIFKLQEESILKLIDREDYNELTDEGLMRAFIPRCLVGDKITTRLCRGMEKVVERTNSRAILSQLNLDRHPRDLGNIYMLAFKRMKELELTNIKLWD